MSNANNKNFCKSLFIYFLNYRACRASPRGAGLRAIFDPPDRPDRLLSMVAAIVSRCEIAIQEKARNRAGLFLRRSHNNGYSILGKEITSPLAHASRYDMGGSALGQPCRIKPGLMGWRCHHLHRPRRLGHLIRVEKRKTLTMSKMCSQFPSGERNRNFHTSILRVMLSSGREAIPFRRFKICRASGK